MRLLLTWIVAFGIVAGLQSRANALDPCEVMASMHEQDHHHHHSEEDHEAPVPCGSSHDEQCPPEHHHHVHDCLCHGMPITDANNAGLRLNLPGFSLSRFRHEGEVAPEGPCLGEDKPPLI